MINRQEIASFLSRTLNTPVTVKHWVSVGGGSISHTYRIITTAGTFFLKANTAPQAAAMFAAEEEGLNLLRQYSDFTIPQVLGRDQAGRWLLLEYIEEAPRQKNFWQLLGHSLAALHRTTAADYGLAHNNYIGSLPQPNRQHSDWGEFFSEERIRPMLRRARDAGLVDAGFVQRLEKALPQITDMMPAEPPSLLHGDLWSGNLLADPAGAPCLIDPAVYYGHREAELAFTALFGGFDEEFYRAYQEAWPLQPGYRGRFALYNLYPLLVHVNLFGRSYLGQVEAILNSLA